MPSLPIEILLGVYLGLLTGILPAFVAGTLGFIVRYFTGVTLPGLGVVVLALSIASINGGLLGLLDPSIVNTPRLLIATLVVLMLSLYAHNQGDRLGAELPKRFSFKQIRQRTLSADTIEFVGGMGLATIKPAGTIGDLEGYPELTPEIRSQIHESSWKLPADLPIVELERRIEDRIRTDFDVADVVVSLDERGRASINAAPPMRGLSLRVPAGKRAVSIQALVPSGLARGEHVTVEFDDSAVEGVLVSAFSGSSQPVTQTDGGSEDTELEPMSAPTTTGGNGRVTVAVDPKHVRSILSATSGRVIVHPRGTTREFEVQSEFKNIGFSFRKITAPASIEATKLATLNDNVANLKIIAIHRHEMDTDKPNQEHKKSIRKHLPVIPYFQANNAQFEQSPRWLLFPGDDAELTPGDDIYVVGKGRDIREFMEMVSS